MKNKFFSITSMLAMTTLFAACGDVDGVPADQQLEMNEARNGALRVFAGPRVRQTSPVSFIEYTITACDAAQSDFSVSAVVALEKEMVLPGGIGKFEDSPLDHNSSHLFADLFQVLDPGCYDVTGTPLDADKNPLEQCSGAESKGLEVLEGATTEAMMIVHCQTKDPGALDVVTVVNHEPRITDITFKKKGEGELVDGSKFVCGHENIFCVEARDADSDPLQVNVAASIDGNAEGCMVASADSPEKADMNEFCFHVKCDTAGRVDLDVTVYDMVRNEAKELITFEEYFANAGAPKNSRAEMSFMTYLGGDEACDDKEHCPDDKKKQNDRELPK